MKKLITCGIAAALCAAAISTQAFATDITEDMSIFADNAEELVAAFHDPIIDNEGLTIDPDTVMPLYSAYLDDFISTGKLELTRETPSGWSYVADVVDSNGEFAGVIEFKDPKPDERSLLYFTPKYNTLLNFQQKKSVAFHLYSEDIKSILSANGISTDVKEVKLAFIDGLGSVYYINTGTEEVLIPAREVSGGIVPYYFEDDLNSVVMVNEELRAKAIREKEETDKLLAEVGEPLVGGTGNPNTGAGESTQTSKRMAVLTVELSALAAAGIGITVINKKRKNKN